MPGNTPRITIRWLYEPTEDAEDRIAAAYRLLLEGAVSEEVSSSPDFDKTASTSYTGMR